ncbi:DNA replication and repair protein RecR [Chishuiella changwenlii]|jgi:recombination protein RecR|uniref:Recombination protein RecR n=1 Tax=Chishuiella changwenlii TaxID=1434701 RepID=A0A1M6W5R3_9FLAO|nr:recombination mediator RecR [Chishuiella changwenlii]GGE88956.1 recombination protein RecR [Chishuiella changwenlii]SHK88846.1 DNA replication and repair protein RecR [Chishuiella changwenlii]
MNYPSKVLEKAVEEMSNLPGIGKRTALRLVLHMLNRPKSQTTALSEALAHLVNDVKYCKHCHTISDDDVCEICSNPLRDETTICVVEDVRDVMAIENTGQFRGQYHVLGGKISPMEGIGPGQLNIDTLVNRVKNEEVKEIIFALSSTMEGDTTVFYLYRQLKETNIIFSTIARGLGVGDELEYADEATLVRSIQHRIPYSDNKF